MNAINLASESVIVASDCVLTCKRVVVGRIKILFE